MATVAGPAVVITFVMSLLSHLFTYHATQARSPTEDFLTEAFAEWLRLAGAAGLLPRVLDELLALPPGQRLPAGDDGRRVRWSTQHVIGPGYRGTGRRPDLVGQGPGFFLIIENKIGAAFTTHEDAAGSTGQLELYLDYQQRRGEPGGGVVLLTHHTDAPAGWRQPVIGWPAVHRWLVALQPDLARRRDSDVLRYWSGHLIAFLEDHAMSGTRINLSDIIALPAFERLQSGMQALGELGRKALTGCAGGDAWAGLRVPRGWTSGDFVEPAFYGALMTPGGVRAHSADLVLWCGVLAGEAYVVAPHIGGIPELSVGLALWASTAGPDDAELTAVASTLAATLAEATPNMTWRIVRQPNPADDALGVLVVQTDLSLIELHRLAGEDFWDEPARGFFVAATDALLAAAAPQWPRLHALIGDATAAPADA